MSLKARRMYFFFFFNFYFFMHNPHARSCSQPIGQQGLDHMNCRLTQFLYCFCRLRVTFTLNYSTAFTEMINLKRKSRSQAVFHKKKIKMSNDSDIKHFKFILCRLDYRPCPWLMSKCSSASFNTEENSSSCEQIWRTPDVNFHSYLMPLIGLVWCVL